MLNKTMIAATLTL